MIRLRARVRCQEDVAEQSQASLSHDPAGTDRAPKIPIPDWIEIEQGHEGGYLLIHVYLREGPFIHTWHTSIESAKAEAKLEFSVEEDEWDQEIVEAP